MNRITTTFAAFSLLVGMPAALSGQACFGVPQGSRGAVAVTKALVDDVSSYGVWGLGTTGEHWFTGGNIGITTYDLDGVDPGMSLGVHVLREIYGSDGSEGDASICPMAAINYAFVENLNVFSLPIGIGFGGTLSLSEGDGPTMTPFVIPQFVWTRASLDDFGDSDAESSFGLSAGATLAIKRFLAGGSFSKVFEQGSDAVFALELGLAF